MIPKSRFWPIFTCWYIPPKPRLCAACHTYRATIAYMDTRICHQCDREMQDDPHGIVAEALTRHG